LGNHYVAIPGPHIGLVPSTPFIIVVGHERDVSCVGVFRQVREREVRETLQWRGSKTFFSCLQHI
jgi:hypothetical protein